MTDLVRKFETGATRSLDAGRYDPEGFLSPLVLERFCEYMNKHRVQPDGSVRASDNWQKGLPKEVYAKGFWRHFLHFFARHRGWPVSDPGAAANIEEDLCAILFNVMGYLHELRTAAVKVEAVADEVHKVETFAPLAPRFEVGGPVGAVYDFNLRVSGGPIEPAPIEVTTMEDLPARKYLPLDGGPVFTVLPDEPEELQSETLLHLADCRCLACRETRKAAERDAEFRARVAGFDNEGASNG